VHRVGLELRRGCQGRRRIKAAALNEKPNDQIRGSRLLQQNLPCVDGSGLARVFFTLEAYVLSAERLHGDDTTVPLLARGKTDTGRIWVYVRDDKPFGGPEPPGRCSITHAIGRANKIPQGRTLRYIDGGLLT
jgi:hypothetical protein